MEDEVYKGHFEHEKDYWLFVSRTRTALQLLRKFGKKDGEILDLGCGTGGNMHFYEEFGKVYGLDIEKKAIRLAKYNNKNMKFVLSGAEVLPFKKNCFDTVLMFEVLEHLQNDKDALLEIKRILKNDGLLVMSVPAHQFLWRRLDDVAHHFRRYNIHDLKELVESLGFEVKFVNYWGVFTFIPLILNNFKNKILENLGKKIDYEDDVPELGEFSNNLMKKLLKVDEKLMMTQLPRIGSTIYLVAKKN